MNFFVTTLTIILLFCHGVQASILISGSSRVYPFTVVIAEEFSFKTNIKPPIIESVGTGGGFSAFCNGNGSNSPDIVNASRPIKTGEKEECLKNNVFYKPVVIGLDAIIIAMHTNTSDKNRIISLTDEELFKALARNIVHRGQIVPNSYTKWSQINPNLPDSDIIVYGPPSTSGTRDTFVDIVLTKYCSQIPEFYKKFKDKTKEACALIRNDSVFVESGENDSFIMQKISLRNGAIGIFGYSHYMENKMKMHLIKINDIPANTYTISTGRYKIARPLFLYFKNNSLENNQDVKAFYKEVTGSDAIGFGGYLEQYHLIPLDKQFLENHKLDEI